MLRGAISPRRMSGRISLVLLIGAAVLLGGAVAARAATLTVTTTADGDDGSCTPSQCTLRDAVNYSSAGDTVVVPAGTYTLTLGQLDVAHDLTINGAAAGSTIVSGNNQSRVFFIEAPVTAAISGMTIRDGNGTGGQISTNGGGIAAYGTLTLTHSVVTNNTEANGTGGGIDTIPNSTVTLQDSTISNNTAPNAAGGGIFADGTWTITGSTITGNTTGSNGAGIFDNASMTITNSTITGNTASGGGSQGGGIFQFAGGLGLTNVTIASNSAPDGANMFDDDESGTVENTIFANPHGGGTNCDTSGEHPTSQGGNLQDDTPPGYPATDNPADCWASPQSSDQVGVDAGLGPLADNGGPTQTMALQPGSHAIDRGVSAGAPATDQRGGPRPQPPGGADDVGAYEVGAVVDTAITKSASPSPATAGQTLTYTLTASNNGPASDPAYAVTVTDTLPSGVSFQSASASQGSCTNSSGTVSCQLGTINNGASATVTIKVTPTAAGTLTNSASVSSSASDPNSANNSASTTTQVQAAAVQAAGTKPVVFTEGVTGVTFTSATLHGAVDPGGASTTYFFEYGTKVTDPNTPTKSAGSGTQLMPVSQRLTGLRPGTLYHYRLVASNSNGTSRGVDRTFRTPRRPSIHVAPARVLAGARVHVFGNAGACSVGDRVTLLSHAFSPAHEFAGVPAVYAKVGRGGAYSTTTRIPAGRAAAHYVVTGRCGGGNLGVSAFLTVFRPVIPKFTG